MTFISKLTTQNWLGTPSLSTALTAFTLFAGPNGAGKTSLLQAIRFCLFKDYPRRVGKKAELPALLSRGAERGEVTVRAGERDVTRRIDTGDLVGKGAPPPMPAVAQWVLSPETFSDRPEGERRALLSELLQVKTSPDAIAERLAAAKLPAAMVEELRGVLTRGFAAAEKHARERASEARGAWKEITGETYGPVKAAEWQPPSPFHLTSEDDVAAALGELNGVVAKINGVNQAIGAASRSLGAEERGRLQTTANKLAAYEEAQQRGQVKRDDAQAAVTRLNDEIERLQAELNAGTPSGTTTPCPHCQQAVVIDRGYLKKPGEGLSLADLQLRRDALAQAREQFNEAVAARAAVDEGLATVANAIVSARAAARQLEAAGDEGGDVSALTAERDALQAEEARLRDKLTQLQGQLAAAKALEGAELRAAIEHQRVVDYMRAEELLGANGIPSILVAQTLDPINERLAAVSKAMKAPTIRIDAELVLHFGESPYPLASESEKWRCDAAMAYVLADIGGFHVLMLDRIDVLVDTSKVGGADVRASVLAWLHGLSKNGWQVIAAGSFKVVPRIPDVSTIWLDSNTTGRAAA